MVEKKAEAGMWAEAWMEAEMEMKAGMISAGTIVTVHSSVVSTEKLHAVCAVDSPLSNNRSPSISPPCQQNLERRPRLSLRHLGQSTRPSSHSQLGAWDLTLVTDTLLLVIGALVSWLVSCSSCLIAGDSWLTPRNSCRAVGISEHVPRGW